MVVDLEPVALEPANRRRRRRGRPPPAQSGGKVPPWRPRHHLLPILAAVVVAAVAVAGLTGAGPAGRLQSDGAAVPVAADAGSSPPPSSFHPLARGWRLVRPAPIAPRSFALSTWTGRELLVWGGSGGLDRARSDGAAYYPDTDQWRLLPPAPLLGQGGLASVWTGQEWIIWGGHLPGGVPGEGAAYNPRAGTWRVLAPAPIRSSGAEAVWTGREMLVWGGSSGAPGVRGAPGATGAAYDPERDRWRRLPPGGPNDVAGRAVWTGREMVLWGYMASEAFDPATNRWRRLPPPPVRPWFTRTAVWTGTELVAVGGASTGGPIADAAAYDPVADSWRRLAPAPDAIDVSEAVATWTGRLLVIARGPSRLDVYDPARDAWEEVAGLLDGPRVGSIAVWTGVEVVFWGGYGTVGTPPALEQGVAWQPLP